MKIFLIYVKSKMTNNSFQTSWLIWSDGWMDHIFNPRDPWSFYVIIIHSKTSVRTRSTIVKIEHHKWLNNCILRGDIYTRETKIKIKIIKIERNDHTSKLNPRLDASRVWPNERARERESEVRAIEQGHVNVPMIPWFKL